MIDLHCHLLPGIDDGPADMDMALHMARIAVADGITTVACTPHILPGVYDNSRHGIELAIAALKGRLAAEQISLALVMGADVHVAADLVEGLRSGRVPTLNGSRYFLLEPPHHVAPPNFEEHVFEVLAAGYVPIITHPERLTWVEARYRMLLQLVRSGALVQITAGSLTGRFGPQVQQMSERMLKDGLVHILASDGHNLTGRRPTLSRARDLAAELLGTEEAEHLVSTRPAGILQNCEPGELAPLPPPAKGREASRLGWRSILDWWSGIRLGGAAERAAVVAAVALLLGGCVGSGSGSGATQLASLPPPDPVGAAPTTEQRISPLDTLDVAILQAPELNRTVQVDAGGQISLPLLGTLKVSGRTVRELEADLAGRYGARYLQSPQVSIGLKESPNRQLTVEGAVRKPGVYPVAGRTTLLQTIALSGGLDTISDPSAVMVFRMVNKQRVSASFDIRTIRTGSAPDPELYPGDMVVVGESAIRTTLRDIGTVMPVTSLLRPF